VIKSPHSDEQSEFGDLSCSSRHENGSYDWTSDAPVRARTLSMVGEVEAQLDLFSESGDKPDGVRILLVPLPASSPATMDSVLGVQDPIDCHGNALTRLRPGKLPPFVAHWQNIVVGRNDCDGTASCALCTSCVDAICGYREETEEFAKRFEELLTRQGEVWERAGWSEADICELAFNFQQAYYGKEPFYNTYVADSDDSGVLRYLCARDKLALPSSMCAKTCELKASESGPLSIQSRARCPAFYQPFRKFLAKRNITNLRHYGISTTSTQCCRQKTVELIAGSSTEAIIGMYVAS
jgi:hypothetical protein